MRTKLLAVKRRLFLTLARGDAGMSSMEMAVLTAILLTMATTVGIAMSGKLTSLMAAFTGP